MLIESREYWKQINSLAEDLISECKHDDLDEIDSETLIDRLHETIDGHPWIIYYGYNDDVIKYTDNENAWEDCYSREDIGALVVDKGMEGARTVQAFFAMYQDVMEAISVTMDEKDLSWD